ncbi:Serine/threonine-protein kinase ppk25 [Smittium mucronatum]|uniref:Serine/threonine-protein kinase ppk25 n=1 Tax=Smittium mucronatum TaxID=133383 RepID=A0A1R0H8J7_9FUNG|nr:Serine/threonine-protein kinase ppk25 [Smittium mucronatum]
MVTGRFPFSDPSNPKNFSKIEKGDFKVPTFLSADITQLIKSMINPDKRKRVSIDQVLGNSWLNSTVDSDGDGLTEGPECCVSCTESKSRSNTQRIKNLDKVPRLDVIDPFVISEVSACLEKSKLDVYNEIKNYQNLIDELQEFGCDESQLFTSSKVLKSPIVSFYFLVSKQIELHNWFVLKNNKISTKYNEQVKSVPEHDSKRCGGTESTFISKIREIFKYLQPQSKPEQTQGLRKQDAVNDSRAEKETTDDIEVREIGVLESLRERILVPRDMIQKTGSSKQFMDKLSKFLLIMGIEYTFVAGTPVLKDHYEPENPLILGCIEKKNLYHYIRPYKSGVVKSNYQNPKAKIGFKQLKRICGYAFGKLEHQNAINPKYSNEDDQLKSNDFGKGTSKCPDSRLKKKYSSKKSILGRKLTTKTSKEASQTDPNPPFEEKMGSSSPDAVKNNASSSGGLPEGFRYSTRWVRGKQRRVMVKDTVSKIQISDEIGSNFSESFSDDGVNYSIDSGIDGIDFKNLVHIKKRTHIAENESIAEPTEPQDDIVKIVHGPVITTSSVIIAQYTPDLSHLGEKAGEEIDEIGEKISTIFKIELVVSRETGISVQMKPNGIHKPKYFIVLTRLSGSPVNFNNIATNLIKFTRKNSNI